VDQDPIGGPGDVHKIQRKKNMRRDPDVTIVGDDTDIEGGIALWRG